MSPSNFEDWYNRKDVLFEIVKQLVGRETSFLSGDSFIRCIKSHKVDFLLKNMKRYAFFKHRYNIYRSVAYLNGMPMFSFDINLKRKQQMYMVKYFKDYVEDYDLVMDFDSHIRVISSEGDLEKNKRRFDKDHISYDVFRQGNHYIFEIQEFGRFKMAYIESKEMKDLMDTYKVPYSLIFSGGGFHFEINGKYLNSVEDNPFQKVKLYDFFANTLKKVMRFETLDVGIYNLRRVWKPGYVFDYKTGRISLPLTDEQFENFSFDIVSPDNINCVRNRGILTRYEKKDDVDNYLELQENVKKMFDEILYGK